MGLDSFLYLKQEHNTTKFKNLLFCFTTEQKLDFIKKTQKDNPSIELPTKQDLAELEGIIQKSYITISQEIAYWRKCNQIHNYFIQNYADTDNCEPIDIDQEAIIKLVSYCQEIINNATLIEGWVNAGTLYGCPTTEKFYTDDNKEYDFETIEKIIKDNKTPFPFPFTQTDDVIKLTLWHNTEHTKEARITLNSKKWGGAKIDFYEKGKVLSDTKLARNLLPTTEGFFFGDTDYNEYYLQDLKDTIKYLKPYTKKKYQYDTFVYEASW